MLGKPCTADAAPLLFRKDTPMKNQLVDLKEAAKILGISGESE